ncbi:MAG: DNA-binding XRE family transcriptional regulator [Oleispira sp.]|jgi:DNA-binding XRE family transcriptional regulator
MHSAEFKTLRESLGLTISTLVKIVDVDERTLRKWEAGKKQPPQGVVDTLIGFDDLVNKTVVEIFTQHQESMKNGGQQGVVLERFVEVEDLVKAFPAFEGLPTMTFGVVLFRVRQRFIDLGIPVSIIYAKV